MTHEPTDSEKIAFADAVLEWIGRGGVLGGNTSSCPPAESLDDLGPLGDLLARLTFPDGEHNIRSWAIERWRGAPWAS